MIDNRCSQFSLLLTVLLFATTSISVVSGQPTGVHLLLRGAVYSNNSIISTNEIGETNSTSNTGLQCITDRRPCCATVPNRFGEWLFPDGTVVPTQGRATSFYRTRRDNGTVNLNRLNTNVFMPTGLFCCVVPDALNVMQRICAIIYSVSVVSSAATPTVGSMYSLTCTVTLAEGLTDAMVTYQWLKNGTAVSDETLSFSPLTFSDAGSYTCQVTVTSDPISTASSNFVGIRLTLPGPTMIRISTNQTNPLVVRPIGSTVTLTCMADLDPAIDVPVAMNIQLRDPAGSPLATTTPSVSGSTYTTAATISSFGRSDSGVYTCTAAVSPSPSNPFLSSSSSQSETLRVTTGVHLLLRGAVYSNNSIISTNEITSNTGLQCITDRRPCCATVPNRFGEWLFPDGTTVPTQGRATSFYRTREDNGTVNLNRLNTNIFISTGLFCCVVPDALDVTQRICTTISSTSIDITVHITGSVATPALGQSYSLTCEVTGASGPVSAYQWRRDDTVLSETGSTVFFSSLRLSDAGRYTCQITVDGIMLSHTKDIRLIGVMVQINFEFISDKDSMNISFSLTCNSIGGQASGVVWMKDDFLLDNTDPLVVIDASTFSYTSVLMVNSRAPGTYTCTIRTNDQVLNSANFIVQASAPPMDVVATQSGSSAPVEVSWSPPSDAAPAIIGYRIFFGNGQNLLLPLYITSIGLNSSQVGSVSIRSESTQLPSALITATVTTADIDDQSSSKTSCRSSSEVGIAVGVILVVGIIAAVTAITVFICWRRKSSKSKFAVSANMAYDQVKLGALRDVSREYEDPEKLARSGGGGRIYEPTKYPGAALPYEFPVSKPEAAPVYATALR